MTSVPSRPRLMPPLRSVMHSPRLTNRTGVLTRIAPPSTAIGTVHNPMLAASAMSERLSPEKPDSAVERIAREHHDKDDALQYLHGGVRQTEAPLQESAACTDTAEEDSDRRD